MVIVSLYNRVLNRLLGKYSSANMAAFHKTVVNTVLLQIAMIGFTTFVSIFISRELGVEGRGIVSWMLAFSSFGSISIVLGLGQASKKYIATMPSRVSGFIVFDLIIMLISLIIFLPLLYYFGMKVSVAQNNYHIFICALLMIPYLAFTNLFNEVLIGLGRSLRFNVLFTLEKSISNVLKMLLILVGMVSPITVIAVTMFAIFCRLSAGISFVAPYIRKFPKRSELFENYRIMKRLIFSAYFSNLALYLAGSWLTIILGLVSSAKELGYFSAVKLLTDTGLMIPSAMASFIVPQLAKQTSLQARDKSIAGMLLFALALILAVALPMLFFPHLIITLLFGHEFAPAADTLPYMALGMISASMILVTGQVISSMHKEHYLITNSGVLVLSIGVLTLIYSHDLNAMTASYIYAISYTIGMIISLLNMYRTQHSQPVAAKA